MDLEQKWRKTKNGGGGTLSGPEQDTEAREHRQTDAHPYTYIQDLRRLVLLVRAVIWDDRA